MRVAVTVTVMLRLGVWGRLKVFRGRGRARDVVNVDQSND